MHPVAGAPTDSYGSALPARSHGRRAGSLTFQITFGLLAGSALRTALFLVVAVTISASLALLLPVNRYYKTVDYAEGTFDIEVNAILDGATQTAIRRLPGVVAAAAFHQLAPVTFRHGDRQAAPGTFDVALDPEGVTPSWFADSTTLSGPVEVGESWVDISAGVARALGVGAGGWLEIVLGPDVYQAQIRRVMATARDGWLFAAVGPLSGSLEPILARMEGGTEAATHMLIGTPDAENVVWMLGSLLPPKGGRVRTRAEAVEEAAGDDPFVTAPIIVAMTGLGLATLAGLAVREGALVVTRRRRELAILLALGVTSTQIATRIALVEAGFVSLALGIAYLLVKDFAFAVVFAAALPPRFVGLLIGAFLIAAGAYLVSVWLATRWNLRRVSVMEVLAAGAAR